MTSTLVVIAKDEARFIPEWIAHYLCLGFDQIHAYDNGSSDQTLEIFERLSRYFPVKVTPWTGELNESPQISAYNDALRHIDTDWVAFFDMDEFLILPLDTSNINVFLQRFGDDVGAVGINWLTFGSNRVYGKNYGLVRNAFRTGNARTWANNKHIKTIARTQCIGQMRVHECSLTKGRFVHPNLEDISMPLRRGVSDMTDHSVAQLNHYQTRSYSDYWDKINRGRAAAKNSDIEMQKRKNPDELFEKINSSYIYYNDIDRYNESFYRKLEDVLDVLVN